MDVQLDSEVRFVRRDNLAVHLRELQVLDPFVTNVVPEGSALALLGVGYDARVRQRGWLLGQGFRGSSRRVGWIGRCRTPRQEEK